MKTGSHPGGLVTIATYDGRSAAAKLKSWLRGKNIPAKIQDETRLQRYWFLALPKAGIHVQIPMESFENVRGLFHKRQATRLLRRAVRCPSCNSCRVQYPDLSRRNILPTLFAQVLVLLHIIRHRYYCEDCHFSWPGEPHRRPLRKLEHFLT